MLVEEIAKTCVEGNVCRYSYFKRLLKESLEKVNPSDKAVLPTHDNLRGKEEYR